jgi:hypothetical protein
MWMVKGASTESLQLKMIICNKISFKQQQPKAKRKVHMSSSEITVFHSDPLNYK